MLRLFHKKAISSRGFPLAGFATKNKGLNQPSSKFEYKEMQAQLTAENNQLKYEQALSKDDKFYMTRMSEKRVEKIGSKSLLDKAWSDRPINVIKNPH